jgi:hypothetical protein
MKMDTAQRAVLTTAFNQGWEIKPIGSGRTAEVALRAPSTDGAFGPSRRIELGPEGNIIAIERATAYGPINHRHVDGYTAILFILRPPAEPTRPTITLRPTIKLQPIA